MAGAYKASRGKGVRRGSLPRTMESNSPKGTHASETPVTPPTTLPAPQPLSPTPDEVSSTQPMSQAAGGTDSDSGSDHNLSSQQRGPRGAYLSKNIPKNPSERILIHIIDNSHYLEPIAARTITKIYKSHFHGTKTQWNLLDKDTVDFLYKSFQD